MKKILAVLLMCAMLFSIAAPTVAMAANNDGFVGSVQQEGDPNKPPYNPNNPDTPATGDDFPTALVVGAMVLAAAGVVCFAVVGKKKKSDDN